MRVTLGFDTSCYTTSVALAGEGGSLMVTPRDIDQRVSDMAKVIGFGINLALQSGLTVEDVELFLS